LVSAAMPLDIPCFVINLPRSADRRAHMSAELSRAGTAFEFVEGVDGRALGPDGVRKYAGRGYSPFFAAPLPVGHIGCTLGHRRVLQTVAERNIARALVFEDDAVLAPGFAAMLKEALAAGIDWDCLKLDGPPPQDRRGRILARLPSGRVIARTPLVTLLATAYVITARGAQKLLRNILPVREPFDFYLQRVWVSGLNVCNLLPYPVRQAGLASATGLMSARERSSIRLTLWRRAWKIERTIGKRYDFLRRFGWRTVLGLDPLEELPF
jgi:glycosyl transferase family 25